MKPDGTDERKLGLTGRQPVLAPNGRYLAFMRKNGAVWRIAVAPALGSGKFGPATELSFPAAGSQAWMPSWTSDSQRIVFAISSQNATAALGSVTVAGNYLTATAADRYWSPRPSRPACSPSGSICVVNDDDPHLSFMTEDKGDFRQLDEMEYVSGWGADIYP